MWEMNPWKMCKSTVTLRLGRDFVCGIFKKQADGLLEPVERPVSFM